MYYGPVTRICQACGVVFEVTEQLGRMPKYCPDERCRKQRVAKAARERYARLRAQGMPAKQSRVVPCAGCGSPLAGGRGSLPEGQRKCQDCRRSARSAVCESCGEQFERDRPGHDRRFCSPECASAGREKDDISYDGAHSRVYAVRGRAADHACALCGGVASEWAYDGLDADERRGKTTGRGGTSVSTVRYSADPWHYLPFCTPCHATYDRLVRAERRALQS